MLAIILQQCTIQAGAPPDIFCGAVQEFHECQTLVVEEDNLLNMEEEIWEGLRKNPMVATVLTRASTPEKTPPPRGVPLQMARAEELANSTSPDPPSVSKQEGASPCQDLALEGRQKVATSTTQVFSLGSRWPHHTTLRGHIPAWSHHLV